MGSFEGLFREYCVQAKQGHACLLSTPKQHLLAVDSINCLNKGCYPGEKDFTNCIKGSYIKQMVFPAVFITALPFGHQANGVSCSPHHCPALWTDAHAG